MGRDALPPLLRGIGLTIILLATVIAFASARQDVQRHRAERLVIQTQRRASVDLKSSTTETSPQPDEMKPEDIVEEVLENPWFEWLSFIGSGIVTSSFYAEWHIRRPKRS